MSLLLNGGLQVPSLQAQFIGVTHRLSGWVDIDRASTALDAKVNEEANPNTA